VDRLVPARDPGDARRRVPGRDARLPAGKPHRLDGWLIPYTCNEIHKLLATAVLRLDRGIRFTLRWSHWRRRHQARAELAHYQRRGELIHHPSRNMTNKIVGQDQIKVSL
jgi:hypothetical protein